MSLETYLESENFLNLSAIDKEKQLAIIFIQVVQELASMHKKEKRAYGAFGLGYIFRDSLFLNFISNFL